MCFCVGSSSETTQARLTSQPAESSEGEDETQVAIRRWRARRERHHDEDRDVDESIVAPATYAQVKRKYDEMMAQHSDPMYHYRMLLGQPPVKPEQYVSTSSYKPEILNENQYLSSSGVRKHRLVSEVRNRQSGSSGAGNVSATSAADARNPSLRPAPSREDRPLPHEKRQQIIDEAVEGWKSDSEDPMAYVQNDFLPLIHEVSHQQDTAVIELILVRDNLQLAVMKCP